MKRFAYGSLGVLCLVAAYQLGASRSEAQVGGPFVHAMDHAGWVLDSSGQAWNVTTPVFGEWNRWSDYDAPVPVLVTWDGAVWAHDGMGTWIQCTTGPVSVDPRSWGSIKGGYR